MGVIISAADWEPVNPEVLSQGDLVPGQAVVRPAREELFVEVQDAPGGGHTVRVIPRPPGRSKLIVEARVSDVIILSHSCDLDSVLRQVAGDSPSGQGGQSCLVAPVQPLDQYATSPGYRSSVVAGNVISVAYCEAQPNGRPSVIDFMRAQFVSMKQILLNVDSPGRAGRLTAAATSDLMMAFAYFLGAQRPDDGRIDRSLLARAINAVRNAGPAI